MKEFTIILKDEVAKLYEIRALLREETTETIIEEVLNREYNHLVSGKLDFAKDFIYR